MRDVIHGLMEHSVDGSTVDQGLLRKVVAQALSEDPFLRKQVRGLRPDQHMEVKLNLIVKASAAFVLGVLTEMEAP